MPIPTLLDHASDRASTRERPLLSTGGHSGRHGRRLSAGLAPRSRPEQQESQNQRLIAALARRRSSSEARAPWGHVPPGPGSPQGATNFVIQAARSTLGWVEAANEGRIAVTPFQSAVARPGRKGNRVRDQIEDRAGRGKRESGSVDAQYALDAWRGSQEANEEQGTEKQAWETRRRFSRT